MSNLQDNRCNNLPYAQDPGHRISDLGLTGLGTEGVVAPEER